MEIYTPSLPGPLHHLIWLYQRRFLKRKKKPKKLTPKPNQTKPTKKTPSALKELSDSAGKASCCLFLKNENEYLAQDFSFSLPQTWLKNYPHPIEKTQHLGHHADPIWFCFRTVEESNGLAFRWCERVSTWEQMRLKVNSTCFFSFF